MSNGNETEKRTPVVKMFVARLFPGVHMSGKRLVENLDGVSETSVLWSWLTGKHDPSDKNFTALHDEVNRMRKDLGMPPLKTTDFYQIFHEVREEVQDDTED